LKDQQHQHCSLIFCFYIQGYTQGTSSVTAYCVLENMEIAMHCNLRPPKVEPIVLGLNYGSIMHQPTNSTVQQPPQTHDLPKHQISAKSNNTRLCFDRRCILTTPQPTALATLNGKPAKNALILRWQIFPQNLDYTVEVIRGHNNCTADCLSRLEMSLRMGQLTELFIIICISVFAA